MPETLVQPERPDPECVSGGGTYRTAGAVDPRTSKAHLVTITWYRRYFDAQQAADILARAGLPTEQVCVVGGDLRLVEEAPSVSAGRSATVGGTSGGWAGIAVAVVFAASRQSTAALAWLVLAGAGVGAAIGALLGALLQAALRPRVGEPDGHQLVAGRYELRVPAALAGPAYQILRGAETEQAHVRAVTPVSGNYPEGPKSQPVAPVVPAESAKAGRQPNQAASQPTQAARKPGEAVSQPAKAVSHPGQATSQPSHAARKPGQTTRKPTQVGSQRGHAAGHPTGAGQSAIAAQPADQPSSSTPATEGGMATQGGMATEGGRAASADSASSLGAMTRLSAAARAAGRLFAEGPPAESGGQRATTASQLYVEGRPVILRPAIAAEAEPAVKARPVEAGGHVPVALPGPRPAQRQASDPGDTAILPTVTRAALPASTDTGPKPARRGGAHRRQPPQSRRRFLPLARRPPDV